MDSKAPIDQISRKSAFRSCSQQSSMGYRKKTRRVNDRLSYYSNSRGHRSRHFRRVGQEGQDFEWMTHSAWFRSGHPYPAMQNLDPALLWNRPSIICVHHCPFPNWCCIPIRVKHYDQRSSALSPKYPHPPDWASTLLFRSDRGLPRCKRIKISFKDSGNWIL
jgi:hypothetical protein